MIHLKIKTLLAKLISIAPTTALRQLLDLTTKALNKKNGALYTFCERPSSIDKFVSFDKDTASENIAIIMQGPYISDDNFTKNTLGIYKSLYPNKIIILSTWKNLISASERAELSKAGVVVVESEPPQITGTLNINFQMRSTAAGLKWIQENSPGVTHILKTRTDQRMYQSNLFSYLLRLQSKLSSENKLVSLSFHSKKAILGSISDMFVFGNRQQIEKYFSLPEQDFSLNRQDFFSRQPRPMNPEQIFFKNFTGKIPSSFSEYQDLVSKNFVLIDKEQVDFYWHKYSNIENKKVYNNPPEEAFWSFAEYLGL